MSLLAKSFSSKFSVAGDPIDEDSPKLIGWKANKSPPAYGIPRLSNKSFPEYGVTRNVPTHKSFQKNWAALSSTLRERTFRRRAAITESDTDWGLVTSGNESDDGKAANLREIDEETVETAAKIAPLSEIQDVSDDEVEMRATIDCIQPDFNKEVFYASKYVNSQRDSGFHSVTENSLLDASLDPFSSGKVQRTNDGFYRQVMTSDENIDTGQKALPYDDGVYEESSDSSVGGQSAFLKAIDDCFSAISYYSDSLSDHSDHTYEAIPLSKGNRRKDDDDLIELCRLAVEILSQNELPRKFDYPETKSEKVPPPKGGCGSIKCRSYLSASSLTECSQESLPPPKICQSRKSIFESIATTREVKYGGYEPPSVPGICKARTELFEALSGKSSISSGCLHSPRFKVGSSCSSSTTSSNSSSLGSDGDEKASYSEGEVSRQSSDINIVQDISYDEEIYALSPPGSKEDVKQETLSEVGGQSESPSESISLPSVSSVQSLTFTEIFNNAKGNCDVLKLTADEDEYSSTDDGIYNVPRSISCDNVSDTSKRTKRRVAFRDEVCLFEVETEHPGGDGFKKKEKRKSDKQKMQVEQLPVVEDFNWSDLSDEKSDLESECGSDGDSSCSCSNSSVEFRTTSILMKIINSITRCRCIGTGRDYDRLTVRDRIRSGKNTRKRRESYDSGISRSSSESSLEKLAIDWYGSNDSNIDIDRTLSILEEKAKQCEEKLLKQLAKSISESDYKKLDKKSKKEKKGSDYAQFYKTVSKKENWVEQSERDEEEDIYNTINELDLEREMSHWRDGESPLAESPQDSSSSPMSADDGKHSLLQFALQHFRQNPNERTGNGEDVDKKKKSKKPKEPGADWTWKQQVDMVKFSKVPISSSLLRLDSSELSKLAVECFLAIMRYMGDLPMGKNQSEVDCVYTLLMNCHKHAPLRDEVYCQLMKQTTSNRSARPDSCQRGWRLLCIVAAYFDCSQTLQPYLLKYLESAAYDKRRAYHGTALVCLQNLRKTIRYGGRKNVPSIEEITALTAGRNAKRQIYQLPGGTERIINTKSTTVVQDIIEEICLELNVRSAEEMEEFSLYCIVEGDTFTMPLAREEYILDVTTELHKNEQVFYLIFCRSVWHHPLRLDSHLYVEVAFNQIAPDYLEGLLLVMPGEALSQETVYDIAKIAALLHRAPGLEHVPNMKETKFLLPKPALAVRDIKPPQWVSLVQSSWKEVDLLKPVQAKAQVLEILQRWPLFGSSFFAVKRVAEPGERAEHILALNRRGVHFLDVITHETLIHYPFSEVISTRKVKSEDGALFLDMKCGNLMQQRITRIQTDQAHEISRLIRQYISIEQRQQSEKPKK